MQAIISISNMRWCRTRPSQRYRASQGALHLTEHLFCIAETLGSQFAEMAKNEPMLEAHSQIATYRGGRLRISWRSAPTIEVPISTKCLRREPHFTD